MRTLQPQSENWLRERDDGTLAERSERLEELALLGEPEQGRMLFGGVDVANALWEAQSAYVNGLDLSAILVSQVCLEKLLASLIELGPEAKANRSYARLLEQAAAERFISDAEYRLFDRLRKARNPYTHYRDIKHRASTMRRAMDTGDHPDLLLRRDAYAAVSAILELVNRPPFALGNILPHTHDARNS
jgi:hypothetical protein